MVIGRGLFLSLFHEMHIRQGGEGEVINNLFQKFHVRHEGFLFYYFRKSDKRADTDLIYDFGWPYIAIVMIQRAPVTEYVQQNTFVRMRKRKLQHHLMICLALVDLLTVPAQTPAMVALWKDGILLQQHGCMLLYALRNAIQF